MGIKSLLPVPLNPEKIKEYYDNPTLIFFMTVGLVWGLISVLLSISGGYISEAVITLFFMFALFASLNVFDALIEDYSLDFKEGWKIENILFALMGIVLITIINVIISVACQLDIGSQWFLYTFTLGEETLAGPLAGLHIQFVGLSEALKIDPNLFFNCLQNFFLIAPAEELVFRGVVTYFFAIVLNTVWVGGIIATFGWAMIHTIANPSYQFLPALFSALFSGIIMLGLMIYTSDVGTNVITHGGWNVIATIISYMNRMAL